MTTPPDAFAQFGQTLAFAERSLTAVLRRHLAERQTTPETWYALQLIATRGPGLDREALSRDLEGSPTSTPTRRASCSRGSRPTGSSAATPRST